MIKFTATIQDLKKALSVVALATGDATNSIHSHALFNVGYDAVTLYATDEDKISVASFKVTDLKVEGEGEEAIQPLFTAEPKRIQNLITNADIKEVKFEYEPETKTLNVYASEDANAYISFASFEPNTFLNFEEDLKETEVLKKLPAGVFLTGIKFIQGFLPSDDKNKKFSNLYMNDGVMMGSNGSNKVGAFLNEDFAGLPALILRKIMLTSIVSMIDKLDLIEVTVKISDKFVVFTSPEEQFCFGFRKSILPMTKFPISLEKPESEGFNIERTATQKKLNRLALSSWEDIGVKMKISGSELLMETTTDRKSYERLNCTRITGNNDLEFIIECVKFKNILGLYSASNLDIYVDKKTCTIYSTGELIDQADENVKKAFTAIGVMTLARVV